MAIKLKKQASGSVSNPPPTHMAFFVDGSGNPSLKDSDGNVTPAASTGNPVLLNEQGSTPPTAANAIKLYSKDVSGRSELFALDDLGNEVQITHAGSVIGGAPTINWKGGTPGNPYIAGDTVNATHGSVVMIDVANPDSVTVNLPAITAISAGKLVGIRNLHSKKTTPGGILVVPDAGDAVETYGVGATVQSSNPLQNVHLHLESDGVGRWNAAFFGGGSSLWETP